MKKRKFNVPENMGKLNHYREVFGTLQQLQYLHIDCFICHFTEILCELNFYYITVLRDNGI